jgi:hypothetical protein
MKKHGGRNCSSALVVVVVVIVKLLSFAVMVKM